MKDGRFNTDYLGSIDYKHKNTLDQIKCRLTLGKW